jgi:ABC-type lipoprotein export system ATPase subunit
MEIEMDDVRLALEAVTKTYTAEGQRTRVLRNINLAVSAGEILWINGPSGSGKSSLINIAGLLTLPSSGIVRFDGQDLTHATDKVCTQTRSAQIGMVFQSHNLLPEMTALENVLIAIRAPRQHDRVKALLTDVGLGRLINERAKKLSGGQQQRVAVVRALVNDPQLLLADEPISGLDEENAHSILSAVEAAAGRGCSVLISSHDPAVGRISHKSVSLEYGAII